MAQCADCDGSGECSSCEGTGESSFYFDQLAADLTGSEEADCDFCDGSGECPTCGGCGRAHEEDDDGE